MENMCKDEDQFSDEEVFFGKLTLKELKKHILWDKQREPWSLSATNSPMANTNNPNTSLKIIETQSEPNLRPGQSDYFYDTPTQNSPNYKFMDENDSFVKMETMVEQLSLAPKNNEKTDFNNTLEVIEYILNNPPSHNSENKPTIVKSENIKNEDISQLNESTEPVVKSEHNQEPTSLNASPCKTDVDNVISEANFAKNHEFNKSPTKPIKLENNYLPSPPKVAALKVVKTDKNDPLRPVNTPCKLNTPRKEAFTTPLESKSKAIFKTPGPPLSSKKPSATSLKKTPSKNAYQHISSPIASYIKNCPIVPLVKDVHPKKPLVGASSIPKFVKTCPKSNKENVNLPSVAYKSAKKTQLIDIPDENKLPQSQWAKKITSTLPKPVVIKHNHREVNLVKKALLRQSEDSFADLTYHQAEVSVCTQKSAFK